MYFVKVEFFDAHNMCKFWKELSTNIKAGEYDVILQLVYNVYSSLVIYWFTAVGFTCCDQINALAKFIPCKFFKSLN